MKSINFIANQAKQGRLHYAQARRKHLPIRTGVVEAAAKTVANVRMKRAGAREAMIERSYVQAVAAAA
jgi:hypothetical protein